MDKFKKVKELHKKLGSPKILHCCCCDIKCNYEGFEFSCASREYDDYLKDKVNNKTKAKNPTKKELLDNVFEITWLVRDQVGNVIASGDCEESDIELHKKCNDIILWFNKLS